MNATTPGGNTVSEMPAAIPLKQWKVERAEELGISRRAVEMRLIRGQMPYPPVVRINKRVIVVLTNGSQTDLTRLTWKTAADRAKWVGKRVVVYSGPHYGKVHQVTGVSESLAQLYHSTSRDRFSAPFCDLEVVP